MNNTKTKSNNTSAKVNNKRLSALKASRKVEKQALQKLQNLVLDIANACNLDEERTANRIAAALKSEYGRINGMINLLAAIGKWPVERGDESMVATNQRMIEKEFKLDLMLLEDISTCKGYHTFHTDALEVIGGVEPQYELYEDNCTIFLEELGCKAVSAAIEPTVWERYESRAKERTENDVVSLRQAVAEHKALMA